MTKPGSDSPDLTCPNAPPEVGAALFGIVQGDGKVAYLSPNIPVSDGLLVALENKNIPIENRLRFSGPCMAERCIQWQTDRCSLADKVVADLGDSGTEHSKLPHCGIRATCRWFAQHKQVACGGCPTVIRKPEELYQSDSA
ncbi:MAG: hypothetical protein PHR30_14980 [Gallionellaceae bacterium]|nr:hypothetical protein [Gallionellaceae bacterium]